MEVMWGHQLPMSLSQPPTSLPYASLPATVSRHFVLHEFLQHAHTHTRLASASRPQNLLDSPSKQYGNDSPNPSMPPVVCATSCLQLLHHFSQCRLPVHLTTFASRLPPPPPSIASSRQNGHLFCEPTVSWLLRITLLKDIRRNGSI